MSNAQLYLVIGVPLILSLANTSILVFLTGRMEARFDRMDGRLDRMDGRLDKVDNRFDTLEARVQVRFDRIDDYMRQFFSIIGSHSKLISAALP